MHHFYYVLITLHAHVVGRKLAGYDGACTASNHALGEGFSYARLNPLFNIGCRRPVPVKLV